jgi:hypothetical protein
MKYLIICLISISGFTHCIAQTKKHITDPKAKQLNDNALTIFMRSPDNPDTILVVNHMLDAALKIDSNYYEGWVNKLSLQCHFDHFEDGLKTAKKMMRIFPSNDETKMFCGILQYKTGHKEDALAIFTKLLKQYNAALEKNKKNPENRGLLFNKGIILVLVDKTYEGKILLKSIYDSEKDPMIKSNIAFYVNSTKDQIIDDKIPGK